MNLSRRGFFKGLLGLAAGVVATQLPACGTATPAVAAQPKVDAIPWWKKTVVVNEGWAALSPGRITHFKGEILSHAVPIDPFTASEIKVRNAQADGEVRYHLRRFLPYSTEPLIEGTTPTPDPLIVRDPRVG